MQDFLQEEKATLADALKDAESEVYIFLEILLLRIVFLSVFNDVVCFLLQLKKKKETLTQREAELDRQMEECKHLVRISEQRRHVSPDDFFLH